MKVAHWTYLNGSGLANMAVEMYEAERAIGSDSVLCNTQDMNTWGPGLDADLHIVHSHLPDKLATDPSKKIITVQHGAPEHIFEISMSQGLNGSYGPSDSLAVTSYILKRSDAVLTFWPRQQYIWETMTDKKVYCLPMGIDTTFWKPVPKQRLLSGNPAVFTAENCHTCKWPLDLMFVWSYIWKEFNDARLHAINIPYDQHRWWMPLAYLTGTMYSSFISPVKLGKESLRNFFCAADYYYSPVTYGDYNRVSLEALSCGAKIISFRGNTHAHYWITEGDQRVQVQELLAIFRGEIEPREVPTVTDIKETAAALLNIYGEVLG